MRAPLDQNHDQVPTTGVQLTGCTVTGPSHAKQGIPCQDAWWGYRFTDPRFVITVADGLGSASHADRGAQTAVKAAAEHLRNHLVNGGEFDRVTMTNVMKDAFVTARQRVEREAGVLGQPTDSLHTTLLGMVAGPNGAAASAVGDGGIVGRHEGELFLVVPKEETEYANVTTPLTSSHWEDGYRYRFHDRIDAAAVFTDGVRPFVWDMDDPASPRREFFDQLFEFAASATDPAEARRELCAFLSSENFRTYSGDDKTLVLGRITPASLRERVLRGNRNATYLLDNQVNQTSDPQGSGGWDGRHG